MTAEFMAGLALGGCAGMLVGVLLAHKHSWEAGYRFGRSAEPRRSDHVPPR